LKHLFYILLLFVSLGAIAQNETLFEEGNTLYNDGKYAEAIDKYEAILKTDQHSAELYFNLANAHYKLSNVGPSVYFYEKALQLKPKDQDIINNKAFASNMTVDDIGAIPEVGLSKFVRKVSTSVSFDVWAKITVALIFIFVALVLLYYFSYTTNKKRLSFVGSFVALFLAIVSLGFSFHNFNLQKTNNPAVVFAQESQVKSEPNLRSDEAFTIHEGTKVQVIDTVNNWREIKLADGKTGWIVSSDIKLLNDI